MQAIIFELFKQKRKKKSQLRIAQSYEDDEFWCTVILTCF